MKKMKRKFGKFAFAEKKVSDPSLWVKPIFLIGVDDPLIIVLCLQSIRVFF